MAAALDLGSSGEIRGGSIPLTRTFINSFYKVMNLYVRIIILWIMFWGIPYIVAKIRWKLYKAENKNGGLNYKYWKEQDFFYDIYRAVFTIGLGLLGLVAFMLFLKWFFPEFEEFGR